VLSKKFEIAPFFIPIVNPPLFCFPLYIGYGVLETPAGEEALLIGEQEKGPIDLILTDMVMQKMSGSQKDEKISRRGIRRRRLSTIGYWRKG
jgi:CheY-like chemotaxis protein